MEMDARDVRARDLRISRTMRMEIANAAIGLEGGGTSSPVMFTGSGQAIAGGVSGFPWGPCFDFGISISGAVVTVYAGSVSVGNSTISTIETNITITGDGQFIGLEVDRTAGTAIITGPHNSRPVPEDDKYRTALHVFDLEGGVAVWTRSCLSEIRLQAVV